jgi:hypothetical protein
MESRILEVFRPSLFLDYQGDIDNQQGNHPEHEEA